MDNITEIIAIIGGLLGTAGLWKFAETRIRLKADQKKMQQKIVTPFNIETI